MEPTTKTEKCYSPPSGISTVRVAKIVFIVVCFYRLLLEIDVWRACSRGLVVVIVNRALGSPIPPSLLFFVLVLLTSHISLAVIHACRESSTQKYEEAYRSTTKQKSGIFCDYIIP